MLIRRTSMVSGIVREMELPITKEQIIDYEKGMLVQDAFPNLTDAEREFFLTGITQEEWDEAFPDEDEEE